MQARAVHDAKAAELAAQAKEIERARDAVSVANNKTKAVQATLRAEQDAHAATRTKLDELTRLYQQVFLTLTLPHPLSIDFSLISNYCISSHLQRNSTSSLLTSLTIIHAYLTLDANISAINSCFFFIL